jgi:hypothetical protein
MEGYIQPSTHFFVHIILKIATNSDTIHSMCSIHNSYQSRSPILSTLLADCLLLCPIIFLYRTCHYLHTYQGKSHFHSSPLSALYSLSFVKPLILQFKYHIYLAVAGGSGTYYLLNNQPSRPRLKA